MKNIVEGGHLLVPRIFISSTFYDLKYARESLGDFIKSYGFEPIRFEIGDVGYTPGEDLDKSCYAAMLESDMAIVIVGGRYGSATSDSEIIENDFDKYISVTHREFDTAVQNKIPVYVFIDEAVYHEYRIYEKNIEEFESGKSKINFEASDGINVHRFIHDIKLFPKIPIYEFKEIGDIKNILRKQWADMFQKYLLMKKQTEPVSKMQPSIYDIYSTVQQMDLMLKQIGKVTITNSSEYSMVINEREIEYAAGKISNTFEFVSIIKDKDQIKEFMKFFIDHLFIAYNEGLLEYPFSEEISEINEYYSLFNYDNVLISAVKEHLDLENDIFINDDELYKSKLVERLTANDYLKKMGFCITN